MSKPKIHTCPTTTTKYVNQNQMIQQPQKTEKQHSWAVLRGLLTCKDVQVQQPQPQVKHPRQKHQQKVSKPQEERVPEGNSKKCKKMRCSGSLCNSTWVMARPAENGALDKREVSLVRACNSIDASNRSMRAAPRNEINGVVSAASYSSSLSASSHPSVSDSCSRGMPLRRLSGCYECRMVVDPVLGFTRDPCSICSCPHCGETFTKAGSMEHHQAAIHGVSELGPEDTSKNIVEIIFQSCWLKNQSPKCKIDRILKVHNTQKTISKFEEYRESIKAKATRLSKKHPRCIADGNELLRFHSTTFMCSLGQSGSSNLCNDTQQCNVCSIIRNGFKVVAAGESSSSNGGAKGILTMATSGKAHDKAVVSSQNEGSDKRAMLVCRVIAGRVKKNNNAEGGISMEEYDSVAGGGVNGAYSNLDELYVFNHRAILPCFVVIYKGF